jgi:hypothetical protein
MSIEYTDNLHSKALQYLQKLSIFGLKMYHLATLNRKTLFSDDRALFVSRCAVKEVLTTSPEWLLVRFLKQKYFLPL